MSDNRGSGLVSLAFGLCITLGPSRKMWRFFPKQKELCLGESLAWFEHIRQQPLHGDVVQCFTEKHLLDGFEWDRSQWEQQQQQLAETNLLLWVVLLVVFSQHALRLILELFHVYRRAKASGFCEKKMWSLFPESDNYWAVEAATQISIRYSFLEGLSAVGFFFFRFFRGRFFPELHVFLERTPCHGRASSRLLSALEVTLLGW